MFDNIDDEAKFWDTCSLTDCEDELKVVEDSRIDDVLDGTRLTFWSSGDQFAGLEQIAPAQDTDTGDLVLQMIEERLAAKRASA